jgi:hypothetical protein
VWAWRPHLAARCNAIRARSGSGSEYLRVLDLPRSPNADADALEREHDALAGPITHKAEAIAGLIKQCEGVAAMRKAEADRMRELAAADQRNADRLRDYLLR